MLAGFAGVSSTGTGSPFVMKLGSDLGVEWQESFEGPSVDYLSGRTAIADGGDVFVASGAPGGDQAWIARLDPAGALVWQRDVDLSVSLDGGMAVAATVDDGVLVAASCEEGVEAVRLDVGGGLVWSERLGGVYARSLARGRDGNVYLAGCEESTIGTSGNHRDWIVAIGPMGEILWQKAIESIPFSPMSGRSAFLTADGGLVSMASGCGDTWFAKLTPTGEFYGPCEHVLTTSYVPVATSRSCVEATAMVDPTSMGVFRVDLPVEPAPAEILTECLGSL